MIKNKNTEELIVTRSNNKKKARGFALFPENINKEGRPSKPFSVVEKLRMKVATNPALMEDILKVIIDLIKNGDTSMIRMFVAYMDGQPKQTIDLNPANDDDVDKLRDIVSQIRNDIRKKRTKSRAKVVKSIQN